MFSEELKDILEDLRDKIIKCQDKNLSSRPYTDKAISAITELVKGIVLEEKHIPIGGEETRNIKGMLVEFHCPDMMLSQAIGKEVEIAWVLRER